LAGTILRFRARGTASKQPVDPRRANRARIVQRLTGGSRPPESVAGATEPPAITLRRDVDSVLVALLRESVACGEYRIDAKRVALKLIAAHGL
jgi:hypothetical protein